MKQFFTFIFCLLLFSVSGQTLKLLKKIGGENPNTASGLTQTFKGQTMPNGDLYFFGSELGLMDELWKTSGTTNTTQKLLTEAGFYYWDIIQFTEAGILFKTSDDKLKYFDTNTDTQNEIADIGDLSIYKVEPYQNKHIIFGKNNDTDQAELWFTDLTASGTMRIDTVGDYHFSMVMTASDYGAVVYNSNSFVTYNPVIYDASDDTVHDLLNYVSPYANITEIQQAAMHGKYIFINGKDGNSFVRYIFDVVTKEVYASEFMREVVGFVEHADNIFILTLTQIFRFNTTDNSIERLIDNVYVFSAFLEDNDQLYYISDYNDFVNFKINQLDLINYTSTELSSTNIGPNNYNERMLFYNNELYYTSEDNSSQYLNKYNFNTENSTLVDTIAVMNGALTIVNGLEVVHDELIVSRYTREIGHELYYLNDMSALFEKAAKESIKISPNPATDYIQLEIDDNSYDQVLILNSNGQIVQTNKTIADGRISISELIPGIYYGLIQDQNTSKVFKFIKR